jgi:hypothetical protein
MELMQSLALEAEHILGLSLVAYSIVILFCALSGNFHRGREQGLLFVIALLVLAYF